MSIVETLRQDIESKAKELERLRQALALLEGYAGESVKTPSEVSAPPPSVAPTPPAPTPRKVEVLCSACEEVMYRAYKRVPSGVTVEYWQCSNGQCNNEMY